MIPSQPLPLTNVLRGRLAERILTILLERGGYRVTRLGIEELFDEVKYMDREHYLALGLPEQLRNLPDLLVADPGVSWAKLVEVKFRRSFSRATADELFETLTSQRRFWPQSYAVIIIGQPFRPDDRFDQDYIRVIPPDETHRLRVSTACLVSGVHLSFRPLPIQRTCAPVPNKTSGVHRLVISESRKPV